MDISSMLSGGTAKRQEPNQQESGSGTGDATFPTTNGQLGIPSGQGLSSGRPISTYVPPFSATTTRVTQDATSPSTYPPNHTQYTLPQQSSHSPIGFPQDQRSRSGNASAGGGPRPTSRSNLFSPPPSLHHNQPSSAYTHGVSSLSPTPASHLSQTPLSTRQSPLSVINQPHAAQQSQHSPQSVTPTGASQLHHQQPTQYGEMQSPSLYRPVSTASPGINPASPINHHLHASQMSVSPGAYPAINTHVRHASEGETRAERERSESVSPKTKVPPRPPTIGSRHSSVHDLHNARISTSITGSGMNVTPSNPGFEQFTTPVSQSIGGVRPVLASEITQTSPRQLHAGLLPMTQAPSTVPEPVATTPPLRISPQHNSHHSQKMGMDHLLTPTTEVPLPAANGHNMLNTPARHSTQKDTQLSAPRTSPKLYRPPASTAPSDNFVAHHQQGRSMASSPASQPHNLKERTSPVLKRESSPRVARNDDNTYDQRPTLKRAADSELMRPAVKQRRTHRRITRPPWARFSKHNPRFQKSQANGTFEGESKFVKTQVPPVTNGTIHQLSNEQASHNDSIPTDRPAWLHNPPLDLDLIKARSILGHWEKTFMWNTPYPDLLRAVQDWMFVTLDGLQDVGWSSNDGAVEIEAKIGTLLDRDDQRCNLPVATSTLISPAANKNYRFESQMTELEHKAMNDFLNGAIRDTMQKGRVAMHYQHLYEIDSFRNLSPLGMRAIPPALQRRQTHREPRLRTTTELDKTGRHKGIKARIVKLNIDNIHIFNPMHRYDCRISINLEVNLNQSHLDPAELTIEPTEAKPAEPNRNKDRLSYKHLAYSIDLTKVVIEGIAPKHELELEVDGNLLREHHLLLKAGKPNAFADILCGFLDNATFLMRQRVGT